MSVHEPPIGEAGGDEARWTAIVSFEVGTNSTSIGYDLNGLGGAPRGPKSLTALPDGGVCVLDSANGRLHVARSDVVRTLELELEHDDYAVDVLATDKSIHVLHDAGEVSEITYDGDTLATRPLPRGMTARDVMRLAVTDGNGIEAWAANYLPTALEVESPEAKADRLAMLARAEPIDDEDDAAHERRFEAWAPREARLNREGRGVRSPDGRHWMGELTDQQSGQLVTRDATATIPIEVKATFGSVRIVGFDNSGEIFVLVEDVLATQAGSTVELTIQRYHPDGQLTGVARVPLEEMAMHPRCPIEVQPDGSVYVLVPRRDQVTVYAVTLGTAFVDYASLAKPLADVAPARIDAPPAGEPTGGPAQRAVKLVDEQPQAPAFEIKTRLETFKRAHRMTPQAGSASHWAWYPKFECVPTGEHRPDDAHRPRQFRLYPQTCVFDGWRYQWGIPYTWGGFDSPWSRTDGAPWTVWGEALSFGGGGTSSRSRGPLVGKVNPGCIPRPYLPCSGDQVTGAYYRYIAGIDCSGFVAAAAGYIPAAKPGTGELARVGFDHASARDDGNVVLNVQPMNYFVGTGHVLYYLGRDASTGGPLTLEATVDSDPQGATTFTRLWSFVSTVVPLHRAWWIKGPGDSPYFGFTLQGSMRGEAHYGLPRQSVWYKLDVTVPTRVKLTGMSRGSANLFVYEPYVAANANGATQYRLYAWSTNPDRQDEAADIRAPGTYYVRVLVESVILAPVRWTISTEALQAPPPSAFKDFRPWQGQLGPTAGFAYEDRLWVINQDKYWVWRPLSGWLTNGFLGEIWQDAPAVRADAPPHVPPIGNFQGPVIALLDKRPFDYPGVTAAYVPGWDTASRPYVVLIQRSRFWEKYLDGPGWRYAGRLADMFADAREVDGVLPWSHTGVTAAYSRRSAVVLIQRDRYWQFDDGGKRVDEGWLRDRWPAAPTVDGLRPWEGKGVRGMCTYGSFLGISSNDRFWLLDLASDLWIAHGHLSEMWKVAPGIDVSLVHPIPAATAYITLRMGALDSWVESDGSKKEGHGHLGEDIAPKDCTQGPGQTVQSIAAGKVVSIPRGCGNYYTPMAIEHLVHDIPEDEGPIYSFYGHVEARFGLQEGDWVKAGQPIADLPDPCPGHGFAAHVHLEIKNSHAHLYGPPGGACNDPTWGRLVSMGYATNILGDRASDFDEPDAKWRDLGNCQRELAPGASCRFYMPTRFISERGGGPRPAFGPPCECLNQALTSDAAGGAVRRYPICPAGIETGLPIVPGPGPDPTGEH